MKTILKLVALIALLAIIGVFSTQKSSQPVYKPCDDQAACDAANAAAASATAQAALKEREAATQDAWVDRSKQLLTASLRDPSSAVFKDVFYAKRSDTPATCGWVNAKNAFGGYTGFRHFIVTASGIMINDGAEAFANKWNALCAGTTK